MRENRVNAVTGTRNERAKTSAVAGDERVKGVHINMYTVQT